MNPAVTTPPGDLMPDLWVTMLKSGIMLCIVLALLFLVLYWMRRYIGGQGGIHGNGMIRQIASLHLAPKEKVVLLDVMGRKILIGITANSINCLSLIEADADFQLPEQKETKSLFTRVLRSAASRVDDQ